MPRIRASWLILIAVIIITAAAPSLRDQARVKPNWDPQPPNFFSPAFQKECAEFVERRYPLDPEMLTAAGAQAAAAASILDVDGPTAEGAEARGIALSLLARAIAAGGGPPAWASYVSVLFEGVEYHRLATYGFDPEDREEMIETERDLASRGGPSLLQPSDVAPLLEALNSWQAADPDNGLPTVLESYVLYGLRRDAEALSRWEVASGRPTVSDQGQAARTSVARLLTRMGYPEPIAVMVALSLPSFGFFSRLREGARMAVYEGRLAYLQGRNEDAIRLWEATSALGCHMQESAPDLLWFLVGKAVEGIGSGPAWRWLPDKHTGTSDGPLYDGRFWYGPQHAFYVSQVGEEADAKLRDRLVASTVRSQLLRRYTAHMMPFAGKLALAAAFSQLTLAVARLISILLLLFAAVSLAGRRNADEATPIGTGWKLVIALLGPFLVGLVAGLPFLLLAPDALDSPAILWTSLAPIPVGIALMSLLAARCRRRDSARFWDAWRGNLRAVIPPLVALGALAYLCIGLYSADPRAEVTRELNRSEMSRVVEMLGPSWHNPTIPPDAYRAQYPPETPPESP